MCVQPGLSAHQRRLSGHVPLPSLRVLVSCLVAAWVLKPALLLEGSPVHPVLNMTVM